VGHTKTIIEINGKRYDANSGKLLDRQPATHQAAPSVSSAATAEHHIPVKVHHPAARHSGKHVSHHMPQRSKTLMRHAVTKPITQISSVVSQSVESSLQTFVPQLQVSSERIARAKKIHKSKLVDRFGFSAAPVFVKKVAPLPVKPAPPVKSAPGHTSTSRPAHAPTHHIGVVHHSARVESVLADGLRKANSLKHATPKKTRAHHRIARKLGVSNKTVNLGAGAAAVLLIAAFTFYQNAPNLAMRTAASKAGIHASLPGYQPSGFSLNGPIEYAPGRVTLSFRSNTDNRQYKVIQQTSYWNNEALLGNYVAKNYQTYQTYRQGDRTVYLYDNDNASWVENGIWYQIAGNAALSSDQLLDIAASL